MELTESLKNYTEEKIGSLTKFFDGIMEARVELQVSKNKNKSDDKFRCEVNLYVPRDLIRATENASEMHAAIDLVMPKLRRSIDKYKEKLETKRKAKRANLKRGGLLGKIFSRRMREADLENAEPIIVKRKRFSCVEPMKEAEAIKEMNLIGHDFYLFLNSETERFSVVYKRDDGNYGLIEPLLKNEDVYKKSRGIDIDGSDSRDCA